MVTTAIKDRLWSSTCVVIIHIICLGTIFVDNCPIAGWSQFALAYKGWLCKPLIHCFMPSRCSLEIYTLEISYKSGFWFVYSSQSSFSSNYSSSLLCKGLFPIDSVTHSKQQTQHIKWKMQHINNQFTNFKLYNILNILIKSMSHSGYEQYLFLAYPYCVCHGPMISSHLGYEANWHCSTMLIVTLIWLNNVPNLRGATNLEGERQTRKYLI